MGRPAGSKNKPKEEESVIDTSEGGLTTTSAMAASTSTMEPSPFTSVYDEEESEPEYIEPTVNHEINLDPMSTPGAALLAVGKFYNEAGVLSAALTKHMRTSAGEPELFSFLQRLQNVLGEFRVTVEQIESGISEHLRSSIEEAVA